MSTSDVKPPTSMNVVLVSRVTDKDSSPVKQTGWLVSEYKCNIQFLLYSDYIGFLYQSRRCHLCTPVVVPAHTSLLNVAPLQHFGCKEGVHVIYVDEGSQPCGRETGHALVQHRSTDMPLNPRLCEGLFVAGRDAFPQPATVVAIPEAAVLDVQLIGLLHPIRPCVAPLHPDPEVVLLAILESVYSQTGSTELYMFPNYTYFQPSVCVF